MSEIRKQLTMKAASEIFKLAAKLNIKPKDILGMGGDMVKMGKSLFTEKVNPKLLNFVEKRGDVPPKILEEIKIHIRSLKNASDNQIELFKLNLKDIVNAKGLNTIQTTPGMGDLWPRQIKKVVEKVEKDFALKRFIDAAQKSKSPVASVKQPATSVKDAAKAFKGWKPTVIKGGKDPKFSDGGVAKLNAELNQLPEYYLPMANGGIADHFRKK